MENIFWLVLIASLTLWLAPSDCHSKKSKDDFSFESLLSGMNKNEKEMFKEELGKEFKKFQIPKHHKPKPVYNNAVKKRKLERQKKTQKILPGICDPICAHQCVHGCDFRCCVPGYQVSHHVPRPLPHVTLPGACSLSCSPTCYPECSQQCCSGGPGGMFQSSLDLKTLMPSPTCMPGCSPACFPTCTPQCCNSPASYQQQPSQMMPPAQYYMSPSPPQPMPSPSQYNPPLGGFTQCGGNCPQSCAPGCLTSCCVASQQQIMPPPPPMLPPPPPPLPPPPPPASPPPMLPPSPVALPQSPSSFSISFLPPVVQQLSMMQPPPVTQTCGGTCSTACAPSCDASCCQTGNTFFPTSPAPPLLPKIQEKPQTLSIFKMSKPAAIQPQVEAPLICPSSCLDICLPDCTDSCCRAPDLSIHSDDKKSKIARQLAMLRRKRSNTN